MGVYRFYGACDDAIVIECLQLLCGGLERGIEFDQSVIDDILRPIGGDGEMPGSGDQGFGEYLLQIIGVAKTHGK